MNHGTVTVGAMAKASGLARSTLLYYDRLGLLRPTRRGRGNYRLYSQAEMDRLKQICLYRSMGISLSEIARILSAVVNTSPAAILRGRLATLEREIDDLRRQQRCIVRILRQRELRKGTEMLDKERWTAVMKAAGLTDEAMHKWHVQFEKMEPDAHQEFLESLGMEQKEIDHIRKWAREHR